MKIAKTSNAKARSYIDQRLPFEGSHLSGEWAQGYETNGRKIYVVYSYGWWPLHIYDEEAGVWFENTESYTPTTTKHRSQSRPTGVKPILCDLNTIKAVITLGVNAVVLRGEAA